jgi:hypothetical protein
VVPANSNLNRGAPKKKEKIIMRFSRLQRKLKENSSRVGRGGIECPFDAQECFPLEQVVLEEEKRDALNI